MFTKPRLFGFLEIPKIQKLDRPKIQRLHADPTLFKNSQYLFKNTFDLVGFVHVLKLFTNIPDLLRFHHHILEFVI